MCLSSVCAHCLWLPEKRTISQVASYATDPHYGLLLQSVINALQSLYTVAGLAQAWHGMVLLLQSFAQPVIRRGVPQSARCAAQLTAGPLVMRQEQELEGYARWVRKCNNAQSVLPTLIPWQAAEDADAAGTAPEAAQTIGYLRPECATCPRDFAGPCLSNGLEHRARPG